jgi:hypothetical protein
MRRTVLCNILSRLSRALGKFAHFINYNGKTSSLFSCARSLDCGFKTRILVWLAVK